MEDIAAVRRNIRKEITENNVWDFMFLTGADKSHFHESRVAIHSVQKHFPKHKIIYYDLGLKIEEQFEVSYIASFYPLFFVSFTLLVCLFVCSFFFFVCLFLYFFFYRVTRFA